MPLTDQARGVFAITVTPFHPDGRLDSESVDRMVDFYLGCGVTGLTILGIMGEAPKLEMSESLAFIKQVVARAGQTSGGCGRVFARFCGDAISCTRRYGPRCGRCNDCAATKPAHR